MAVLRYYLNYNNDEDLARGLLVLFLPFQDEMKEIHTQDVKALLSNFEELIENKRSMFEKYKLMTDLISTINTEENNQNKNDEDTEEEAEDVDMETTSPMDIEEFNKWAKNQADTSLGTKLVLAKGDLSTNQHNNHHSPSGNPLLLQLNWLPVRLGAPGLRPRHGPLVPRGSKTCHHPGLVAREGSSVPWQSPAL